MLHERRHELRGRREAREAPVVDGAEQRAFAAVVGANKAVDAAAPQPQTSARQQRGRAAGEGDGARAKPTSFAVAGDALLIIIGCARVCCTRAQLAADLAKSADEHVNIHLVRVEKRLQQRKQTTPPPCLVPDLALTQGEADYHDVVHNDLAHGCRARCDNIPLTGGDGCLSLAQHGPQLCPCGPQGVRIGHANQGFTGAGGDGPQVRIRGVLADALQQRQQLRQEGLHVRGGRNQAAHVLGDDGGLPLCACAAAAETFGEHRHYDCQGGSVHLLDEHDLGQVPHALGDVLPTLRAAQDLFQVRLQVVITAQCQQHIDCICCRRAHLAGGVCKQGHSRRQELRQFLRHSGLAIPAAPANLEQAQGMLFHGRASLRVQRSEQCRQQRLESEGVGIGNNVFGGRCRSRADGAAFVLKFRECRSDSTKK
mmetsp:Transcript_110017/g.350404  ORF Transcript_110017/g.350404 Transcript_110017/m.350404 type:complete len:426 (+) Transcript_110017:1962-3239(+)